MWWFLGVYAVGFIATTMLVFMTGGENHTRGNEWWWVWVNISMWPVWLVVLGYVAVVSKFQGGRQ